MENCDLFKNLCILKKLSDIHPTKGGRNTVGDFLNKEKKDFFVQSHCFNSGVHHVDQQFTPAGKAQLKAIRLVIYFNEYIASGLII